MSTGFSFHEGDVIATAAVPIDDGPDAPVVTLAARAPVGALFEALRGDLGDPAAAACAQEIAMRQAAEELVDQAKAALDVVDRIKRQPDGAIKVRQRVADVAERARLGDAHARLALGKLQLAGKVRKQERAQEQEAVAALPKVARLVAEAKRSPVAREAFRRGVADVERRAAAGEPKAKRARAVLRGTADLVQGKRAAKAEVARGARFSREGRRFVLQLPPRGKPNA